MYVEMFAAPVPTGHKKAYLEHATKAAELFSRFGASRIVENWGADIPDGEVTSFPLAVHCKQDETVVVGWVEWPSKAARDDGMPKVMEAMQTEMSDQPMPFDGKRLIFGGFQTILEA